MVWELNYWEMHQDLGTQWKPLSFPAGCLRYQFRTGMLQHLMTDLQALQVLVNLRLGIAHFLGKKKMNFFSWCSGMGLSPSPSFWATQVSSWCPSHVQHKSNRNGQTSCMCNSQTCMHICDYKWNFIYICVCVYVWTWPDRNKISLWVGWWGRMWVMRRWQ